MIDQALTGQRPTVRVLHGKPKSRLLKKKLPAFSVAKNSAEFLKEQEEAEELEESEARAWREANARPVGPKSPLERKVDAVLTCVGSQAALREVLYKILVFCEEERGFSEVEAFVQQCDEYAYGHLTQTPYTLVHMLIGAQGIDYEALDADGNRLEGPDYEGLGAEDLQNIAEEFRVKTSVAGAEAASLIAPEKRFESLLMQHPHRSETYYKFMEFCSEPRKLPEIQDFYENTPGLAVDVVQIHHHLSADFYLDKLEQAGVLVWRGAWVLDEAGRKLLAAHGGKAA